MPLNANQNTVEAESMYEYEKLASDSMSKLRNELRVLKEDATMYVTQMDELTNQLSTIEEQKKTLSQLLRTIVQQNLSLNQKLQELEKGRTK